MSSSRNNVVNVFDAFRIDLDEHNDRRERLIKSSRDITNLSKKVIFLLHRVMTTDDVSTADKDDRNARAAAQGREKLKEIQKLFAAVGAEVQGDRFWRYQRNVSPGLQEYIEALSFTHYLETGKLISYDEVQQSLTGELGESYFPLTTEDYLLGLSDLTGELMRYAISSISQRGGRMKANEVCTFVRNCKSDFEVFTPHFRELRKKQSVTSSSLEKIEDAAYAIAVRASEYDVPPEMLDDIIVRSVTSEDGGSRNRRGYDDGGYDHDY
ncbi:Translin family-domain-containing protein [Cristinia sonorae]|uniref:Translin family-domain-containing protein n=1 Tax=Cristinia sonorae TaxID=1940300 RepID=A0A8K0UNA7_9AGAR|nr:Translin family-domain-containing protein [Cristinia sonorae]